MAEYAGLRLVRNPKQKETHETHHSLSKSIALSQELQAKASHSHPANRAVELHVPPCQPVWREAAIDNRLVARKAFGIRHQQAKRLPPIVTILKERNSHEEIEACIAPIAHGFQRARSMSAHASPDSKSSSLNSNGSFSSRELHAALAKSGIHKIERLSYMEAANVEAPVRDSGKRQRELQKAIYYWVHSRM